MISILQRRTTIWLLTVMVIFICAVSIYHTAHSELAHDAELSIITHKGDAHQFHVEIANTDQQRATGLMHRTQLDDGHGMLFVYNEPHILSMWMKNTLIPLDMLFIDENGRIVNIATNTVPHSLEAINSHAPAIAVLELNAGITKEHSIQRGNNVLHSIFVDNN